jgi:hypothetical protein
MLAEGAVVEQDAGDDERSGERTAPGFIRSGNKPHAEAAVEPEELLARSLLHAHDDTAEIGRRPCL